MTPFFAHNIERMFWKKGMDLIRNSGQWQRLARFGFVSFLLHSSLVLILFRPGYRPASHFFVVELISSGGEERGLNSPTLETPIRKSQPKRVRNAPYSAPITKTHSPSSLNEDGIPHSSQPTDSHSQDFEISEQVTPMGQGFSIRGTEDPNDPKSIYLTRLYRQIAQKILYPPQARKLGIQGRVKVSLQINEDGEILSCQGLEGDHELLVEITVTTIRKMKHFDPARSIFPNFPITVIIPFQYRLN